mgnify:CR=1 FL=1
MSYTTPATLNGVTTNTKVWQPHRAASIFPADVAAPVPDGSMQKKIAALILLAASAHGAHAAPAQDELGNLLAQKGIVAADLGAALAGVAEVTAQFVF